ncbi:asparagine synthase (glutamine-hydrolyzing) [Planctomycetota bacterium]
MCGIAGIVASDARGLLPQVEAMVAVQQHRGPDSGGVLGFDGCMLGHRRLSIIDLAAGQQPMRGQRSGVAVVFNGEIYGYQDIRKHMTEYPFRTSCDTELLLGLYETYDTGMLDYLPGMFAFAIWDQDKQRLFAARDRFGEKPFYYAQPRAAQFVFASEIKGILASDLVSRDIDDAALAHFLHRLYTPEGASIYRDIVQLPPAHALEYQNGKLKTYRYWSLPEPGREQLTAQDAAGELKRRLQVAVKKQLVADVEVSAFLSGGLDSTTIVSLAAQEQSLRTLAFGFEPHINELPYAKDAADRYGTQHQECALTINDLPGLILKMAHVYDEPFGDSSCIPTYLICQEAVKNAPVALTGDGGDELNGGYGWYGPMCFMDGFGQSPLDRLCAGLVAVAARTHLMSGGKLRRRAARLAFKYGMPWQAHWRNHHYYRPSEIAALGLPIAACPIPPEVYQGAVDMAIRADIADYMPGNILRKVDRASMACSLELRAPFLDVDVAEFLIGLSSSLKVNPDDDKILLRQAFSEDWPPSIRGRHKQGFGAPVRAWLKLPEMDTLQQEYTLKSGCRLHDWISPKHCRRYMARGDYKSWLLLCLGVWLETA